MVIPAFPQQLVQDGTTLQFVLLQLNKILLPDQSDVGRFLRVQSKEVPDGVLQGGVADEHLILQVVEVQRFLRLTKPKCQIPHPVLLGEEGILHLVQRLDQLGILGLEKIALALQRLDTGAVRSQFAVDLPHVTADGPRRDTQFIGQFKAGPGNTAVLQGVEQFLLSERKIQRFHGIAAFLLLSICLFIIISDFLSAS